MRRRHPIMDRCQARECQAEIYWLRHVRTGKWAPITRAPNEKGNIVVDLNAGTYRIAAKDETGGGVRHVSHYADCKKAAQFKSAERKSA